jgi:hypothetical protein
VGRGAAGPSIGIDDQGGTVVGWSAARDDPDVWLRAFGPGGVSAGREPPRAAGRVRDGVQRQLAIAVSPWGEVAASYTDDSDGNGYDQVVLGTRATTSTW